MESQKWRLPASDQLGGKRAKQWGESGAHQHFGLWRKIPAPPAHALKLVNVSITFIYNTGAFQTAASVLERAQPFGSPRISLAGFQSQTLQRLLLLVQVPEAEAWTPRSWWGTPVVVISLPLVSHHTGKGD